MAGLLPEPAVALTRAAKSGAAAKAESIDRAFGPLWALFREFGSFRVMFSIAEVFGYGRLTPPRPVLPLEEVNRQRVEMTLRSLLDAAWGLEGQSFRRSSARPPPFRT